MVTFMFSLEMVRIKYTFMGFLISLLNVKSGTIVFDTITQCLDEGFWYRGRYIFVYQKPLCFTIKMFSFFCFYYSRRVGIINDLVQN